MTNIYKDTDMSDAAMKARLAEVTELSKGRLVNNLHPEDEKRYQELKKYVAEDHAVRDKYPDTPPTNKPLLRRIK